MRIWKQAVLFVLGGICYVFLELLWRGRSHISMFFAGGVCFRLIGALEERKLSVPLRAIAGSGIITAVELAAGLLVNRRYTVWDYRDMPGNFRGQICPMFSFLWMFVAVGAGVLHRNVKGRLLRM